MFDKIAGYTIYIVFGGLAFYVYYNILMAIPKELLVVMILAVIVFMYWLDNRN